MESVAARFGMTPERVLQVNADLQGMHPGDLFSEFKRPVGLLPRHAPHVAAHVCVVTRGPVTTGTDRTPVLPSADRALS